MPAESGSNTPERLYHGSPTRGIKELEPRGIKKRSEEEGAVIFATPTKAAALKNLMFSDDSWTLLATMNNTEIALIAKDRTKFIAEDKGGSCYEIPGEGFVCETKYGGGRNEWTSRSPVKPVNEEVFDSSLDAMVEGGVQVYFVEHTKLQEFENAEDKATFLRNLESENERRGKPKPDFAYHE